MVLHVDLVGGAGLPLELLGCFDDVGLRQLLQDRELIEQASLAVEEVPLLVELDTQCVDFVLTGCFVDFNLL